MEQLIVDGAAIEYEVRGNGEPVVLIPPGGTIDGLGVPLFAQPEIASRFMLINYHRRGYMGSTLGSEPLTIARQVNDVIALLKQLQVKSAHIAGHSFGGAIALQLAIDSPVMVHSIALLEPYLPMNSNERASFQQKLSPIMITYQSGDIRQAMGMFADTIFGLGWQSSVERTVPGGVEQTFNDADTFFRELSAAQTWEFGPTQTAMIHQPVLSVLGLQSSPFRREDRKLLHAWFPQAEDLDIQTNHLLQVQDPQGVAHGLAEFFTHHSMR